MAYQAMARRYRPSTFEEVIGQGHVAQTLQNAIRVGRVAHAYLFCGPHGCGKTSMARIFAKALNCTGGPSAEIPADCPICADIASGNDPDVMEIDGASNNSVDQVRSLREQAGYVPARSRFKVYIIDEVHMLSVAAFNALLKTLEEPPPHVKFILATTEPHKLLETILSRCQRFDFRLVAPPEMAAYLKDLCSREGVSAEAEALEAVAAYSGGSMRDGLVLLDQLVSYCPDGITREDVERVRGVAGAESIAAVYESILTHDLPGALAVLNTVAQQGTGAGDFLDQLIEYGRDLMHVIASGGMEGVSAYGPARVALTRHVEGFSLEMALLILDVFTTARTRVRSRALSNPQVPLEMAVARLAGLEGIDSVGNVIGRIEELARSGALSGGVDLAALPAAAAGTANAEAAPTPEKKTDDSLETPRPAEASAEPIIPIPRPQAAPGPQTSAPSPSPDVPTTDSSYAYDSCAVSPSAAKSAGGEDAAALPAPVPPWEEAASAEAPQEDVPQADSDSPSLPASLAPVEGELTGDHLRARWDAVLEAIHANHPPDSRFMYDIRPAGVENGEMVVLELPAGGIFLMEQLEDRERRERITRAIGQALGREVRFRLIIADGSSEAIPTRRSAAEQQEKVSALRARAIQDPMVKSIMDRFKCEILNVK